MVGKKHSEATRAKQRAAWTPERRAAQAALMKERNADGTMHKGQTSYERDYYKRALEQAQQALIAYKTKIEEQRAVIQGLAQTLARMLAERAKDEGNG